MMHTIKYIWGWCVSIAALPLVLACLAFYMAALLCAFVGACMGKAALLLYAGTLAPKPLKRENLGNGLSRFASWAVDLVAKE